jgi:hypothetical protein
MTFKTISVLLATGLGVIILVRSGLMDSVILVERGINSPESAEVKKINEPNNTSLASKRIPIQLSDNQLSLAITNQPLHEIAKTIAQQAKLDIQIANDVPNVNVDMQFSKLPVQQGLQRLFENYDTFFYYGNSATTSAKLITVWVFPKGKGEILTPMPELIASANPNLSFNTSDSDPQQRASATALVIENNGPEAEAVLQAALDDPEENVRMNALQASAVSAATIPIARLNDLALHDPSATVRVMAITSLLKQFEDGRISAADVTETVNLALNDSESSVAEVAKQIIASFDEAADGSANTFQDDADDPQRTANPL